MIWHDNHIQIILYRFESIITKNNIFIKSPDESDITYGELISYMKDTYSKLSSIKINKEDKVAIVLGNGSSMACTFIAIAANFTSCPLNPSYTKEEFKKKIFDLNFNLKLSDSIEDAIMSNSKNENAIILISGSLYLIWEVLNLN